MLEEESKKAEERKSAEKQEKLKKERIYQEVNQNLIEQTKAKKIPSVRTPEHPFIKLVDL